MDSKALEDFGWFIGIIVILFILWAAAGGKDRTVDKVLNVRTVTSDQRTIQGVKIPVLPSGPTYSNTNTNYSSGSNNQQNTSYPYSSVSGEVISSNRSTYFNKVALRGGTTGTTDPNYEYITIQANPQNGSPINVTGWTVVSTSTGRQASIGQGVYLPFLNDNNAKENISLAPGDKAYVITGKSPTGYSFRLNECIGYFSERFSFYPQLPYFCPSISEIPKPAAPNNFSDACVDYINSYPSCTSITAYTPSTLEPQCRNFIEQEARYDRCVINNKKDSSFYDPEWRIYLNQSIDLWKGSRETIRLLDQYGKIVDQLTY